MMALHHDVRMVRFTGSQLILEINGKEKVFDLKNISSALLNASDIERETFEISPSGYGIYWPLLDEDMSIDGLLGVVHSSEFA